MANGDGDGLFLFFAFDSRAGASLFVFHCSKVLQLVFPLPPSLFPSALHLATAAAPGLVWSPLSLSLSLLKRVFSEVEMRNQHRQSHV